MYCCLEVRFLRAENKNVNVIRDENGKSIVLINDIRFKTRRTIDWKKVEEYLKEYIEERAIEIANYIIENNATVRQTAKAFGISKSTVHMVVTKWNGLCGA